MKNHINLTNKNLLDHKQISKIPFNKEMPTESILLLIVIHMNHRAKIIKIRVNLITIMDSKLKLIIRISSNKFHKTPLIKQIQI